MARDGAGAVAVASLVLPPILARKLSESDFGLYKQIDLAATLFVPFLLLGLDKSITYFVPRKGTDVPREISVPLTTILIAAIGATVLGLLWPEAFARVFGMASVRLLVATAIVYTVGSTLSLAITRALIAADSARLAATLPPLIGVPRVVVLVAVALWRPTLDAILWTLLGFAILHTIVWLGVVVAKGLYRPLWDRSVLARQFRYGGALAFAALAQTWAYRLDRYLVSATLAPAVFAVYSNGKTRIPFLPILANALTDATAPRFSKLESEKRYSDMADLWRMSIEAMLPVGIVVSTFLSVTAEWTIPLYFSDKYVESVPIFQVFAFSIFIQSLVGVEQILRALAAIRFLIVTIFLSLFAQLGLGLWCLHIGSLPLLAGAQLVVLLLSFFVRLIYIRGRLGVPWGRLIPAGALLFATGVALAGVLATRVWIRPEWGDRPLLALGVAGLLWGVLGLLTLWRVGHLGRLKRVLRGRFGAS